MDAATLLEQALAALNGGKLVIAKQLFTDLLRTPTHQVDARHGLAIICKRQQAPGAAFRHLELAIALSPRSAFLYNTQGTFYSSDKLWLKAERAFEKAVNLDMTQTEYRYNLATCHLAQKNYAIAKEHFEQVLAHSPKHRLAFRGLTIILFQTNHYSAGFRLAKLWHETLPEDVEAKYFYGVGLQFINRTRDAINLFDSVIVKNPRHVACLVALGTCYKQLGSRQRAMEYLDRALIISPHEPKAHYYLGSIFLLQGQTEKARQHFKEALRQDCDYIDPVCGLGCVEWALEREIHALAFFKQAMRMDPFHVEARLLAATLLLKYQQFEEGWRLYQARKHTFDYQPLLDSQALQMLPEWQGQALDGPLLLWTEQGLGDTLCFASIIPEILATTPAVSLCCEPRLVSLLSRSFPNLTVITPQQCTPAQFEAHCSLADCLQFYRQCQDDFPAHSGYLTPCDAQAGYFKQKFQQQFGDKIRIGISWRSTNRQYGPQRTIALQHWQPIFNLPDYQYINLQYGDITSELAQQNLIHTLYVESDVDTTDDIDTLASLIASLDLVITIDNSTAHLAGALGIPTFCLLPKMSDWRWFTDHFQSVLYPSMNLFRQQTNGAWQAPFEEIIKSLSVVKSS